MFQIIIKVCAACHADALNKKEKIRSEVMLFIFVGKNFLLRLVYSAHEFAGSIKKITWKLNEWFGRYPWSHKLAIHKPHKLTNQ